ncbi:MAG: hypothetical protein NUW21_14245 [Elusimicrobia bacterium]|nr:hypothetical protein [Elusimicrobiota bacterium]
MTTLLAAFLAVAALPFVLVTWRISLATLSLQGLLMGWMFFRREPVLAPDSILTLVDLVAVRGLLVPFMLDRAMRAAAAPRRGDAILPNMFSLTMAAVLIGLSFQLAGHLAPGGSESQTFIAVAVSALLLGLFTLATQTGVFTQVVGALCVENAIALFELGEEGSSTPLPVELGLASVFLLSACMYVLYVRRLHPGSATEFLAEKRVL